MNLPYGDMRSAAARRDWKEIDQVLADWPEDYFEEGEKYARDCGWVEPDRGHRVPEWVSRKTNCSLEDARRVWELSWPWFEMAGQDEDTFIRAMIAFERGGLPIGAKAGNSLRCIIKRLYPLGGGDTLEQLEADINDLLGMPSPIANEDGELRALWDIFRRIKMWSPNDKALRLFFGPMVCQAARCLLQEADEGLTLAEAADLTNNVMKGFGLTDDQRAALTAVDRQSQFTKEAAVRALQLYDSVPAVGLPEPAYLDTKRRLLGFDGGRGT